MACCEAAQLQQLLQAWARLKLNNVDSLREQKTGHARLCVVPMQVLCHHHQQQGE
jgi:hypothetical protein